MKILYGGGDGEIMARSRSPDRDKAFQVWVDSKCSIPLKDVAEKIGVSPSQIRNWKVKDKWDERALVAQSLNSCATNKKRGAPKGSKNALGNSGGRPPIDNSNAVRHGFFRKIFPDDSETLEIASGINIMSPIEMLWQNIVIQYTAIARAQRIMFVRDKNDITEVLKRQKESEGDTSSSWEKEWEIQHAWDKQATFMQAQSRAMSTLQGMIVKYDEMMQKDMATEEQQLRINKLKAEIAKLTGDTINAEDVPQFIDDIGAADGD